MITIVDLRDLFRDLAPRGYAQVFEDWAMLAGFEAKAECGDARLADSMAAVAGELDPRHCVIETCVEVEDRVTGKIYFAFPNTLVIDLLGELLMLSDSAREERRKKGLFAADIEAFQEMANMLCGSWNRVFQQVDRALRVSQSVDHLKLWCGGDGVDKPTGPDAFDECPDEGRMIYLPIEVGCEDRKHLSVLTLSLPVAIGLVDEFLGRSDPRAA